MSIPVFNIRVYGLLIHNSQILIAEQLYRNTLLRKFPGGGLIFGEGLIDCVKREFMEELNLSIEVTEHFYTTDFFVESMFRQQNQVISVYYKVKPLKENELPVFIYKGLPAKD
ncbi:MAG: NUDIX domain-containing protein, partial [Bacteroidota bacterium]